MCPKKLLFLALPSLLLAISEPAFAVPPQPSYGVANVDGFSGEWNLPVDFFANMHRAGKADKPIESKLYLRYDCQTGTMYVLIKGEPGVPCLISGDPWVAIDQQNNKVVIGASGDDGIPPDFVWMSPAYDGNPDHALGYEASFLLAPGSYEIIAHVNVFDAGGGQTSATIGFPGSGPDLLIVCTPLPVEAVTWSRIKAQGFRNE